MAARSLIVVAVAALLHTVGAYTSPTYTDQVFDSSFGCGAGAGQYVVQSAQSIVGGTRYVLQWTGSAGQCAQFGQPIGTLSASVVVEAAGRLRVHITDPSTQRWEVPDVVNPPSGNAPADPSGISALTAVPVAVGAPFQVKVTRAVPGSSGSNSLETVFLSTPLYFADQYVQFGTYVTDTLVSGMGEHKFPFWLNGDAPNAPFPRLFTAFASDQPTPYYKPLYGSHPFLLMHSTATQRSSGWFLLNSNALDLMVHHNASIYKSVGGVIDMYLVGGPTPQYVVRQYQDLIGLPMMPPYWALGFHQCRYGYRNLSEVQEVYAGYVNNQLPVDTMWMDIDYMNNFEVFSLDPVTFPTTQVQSFLAQLHADRRQMIIIVDPGVKLEPGYNVYEAGIAANVFIQFGATAARGTATNKYLVGKVWPRLVHFTDFTHPNATSYWVDQVSAFHQTLAFDGLWIDMNELANFCDGRCPLMPDTSTNLFTCDCTPAQTEVSPYNTPPYLPGGPSARMCRTNVGLGLDCNTISMSAVHYIGLEYNLHNLYGHYEAIATYEALRQVRGTRPFIISRSTFAGTGSVAGHWLGDNESTFDDLGLSIAGILRMNMFGLPMVGADICGFNGDTNEELCTRWMQLGSFYPFARNHNAIGRIPQEPFAFGPVLLAASRSALQLRYSLLPYWYTLFHAVSRFGGMVIQPLMFAYPSDPQAVNVEYQFLVGSALLVSPVVTANTTSVTAYFPAGVWYDLASGESLISVGQQVVLAAPIDVINVHVAGGSIVPRAPPALTAAAVLNGPIDLWVALDASGSAKGFLVLDDGQTIDAPFSSMSFAASVHGPILLVDSTMEMNGYQAPQLVRKVHVLGWACAQVTGSITSTGAAFGVSVLGASTVEADLSSLQLPVASEWELSLVCAPPPASGLDDFIAWAIPSVIVLAFTGIGVWAWRKRQRALPTDGFQKLYEMQDMETDTKAVQPSADQP